MVRRAVSDVTGLLERLDAGGWALVIASVLVIAPAVLLPAWSEVAELEQQKLSLANHLRATHAQTERTHWLIASVEHGDPMVLTQLAWHELHLKPAGAQPLGDAMPIDDTTPTSAFTRASLPEPAGVSLVPTAPPTLLGELVAGPNRIAFFIVGTTLAGAGLATSLRQREAGTA